MQISLGLFIGVAVALALIVGIITHFVTVSNLRKNAESKIGNAEAKAREIIDDAVKTAETTKKESLLEVKEESIRTKNELEKETKERRAELQRYEKRVLAKEESVDKRSDVLEHRESKLTAKEEHLRQREAKVEELSQKRVQELERISGLTSEQAKEYLLKTVEDDVKHDTAKMVRELETQAKEEADKKAKEYVVNAIQRCAADHVAETTISVVQLPSDEMKGRIIGREGRNIKALETLTGIDLIIDDTPEAVVLSGFDPLRREVAKIALEKLEIDDLGLDNIDRKILKTIILNYTGGPVGIETLSSTIGEEVETIEDVYEPYLMQMGFIARTPRGRIVTPNAYKHLGIEMVN